VFYQQRYSPILTSLAITGSYKSRSLLALTEQESPTLIRNLEPGCYDPQEGLTLWLVAAICPGHCTNFLLSTPVSLSFGEFPRT
jgi:hypothetical protein